MISLILPTLGEREEDLKRLFYSLGNQAYQDFELIVVSQDNHGKIKRILKNYDFNYEQVEIQEKGISNARNIGLDHANGDIITISDDDCWYPTDSLKFIKDYFSNHEPEIVCFQYFDPDKKRYPQDYPSKPKNNISKIDILSVASIEIFIDIEKVEDYKIGFNTNFGLGTENFTGTENIYLMNLKKLGYKIDYYPKIISYHPTKLEKIEKEMYVTKAPLFKKLFGNFFGLIFFIAYTLLKIRRINNVKKGFLEGIKRFSNFSPKKRF